MYAFLLLFLLVIIEPCSIQSQKVTTISIDPKIDKEVLFRLSEYAKNIRYIKLQTNNDCLIDKLSKVQIDSDYIFVISESSLSARLLVFKSNGDFFIQIGKQGRGPGEYSSILDFALDKSKKLVYFLDTMGKVFIYDYSGKFLRSTNLKSNPSSLRFVNNKLLLISAWPDYYLNNGYGIEIKNLVTNESQYLLNRRFVNERRIQDALVFRNYFCDVNSSKSISFYEEKFDTLYNINLNNDLSIQPKLVLRLKNDLPRDLITNSEYRSALKTFSVLTNFIELNDYFFFTVVTPNPITEYFYSIQKSSYEIKKHKVTLDKEYFKNDYDAGLTFKPKGIADEGILYSTIDCYRLKEHLLSNDSKNNPGKSGKNELLKLVNETTLNDNPIIILVTFK